MLNGGKAVIRIESVYEEKQIYQIMEHLSSCFFTSNINRATLSKKIAQFGCFLVGYDGNNVAGFVGYYANDTEGKAGYLTTIVVSQIYQGIGIGNMLLHACLDDCRKKGMTKCRLEVRKDNLKAQRFYSARGFSKEAGSTETTEFYVCNL